MSMARENFVVTVERGVVTHVTANAPEEFTELLELVRRVEGSAYVRELGIGLNPELSRHRVVGDVASFERQRGVHVSLGKRHPLFPKVKRGEAGVGLVGPALRRRDGTFHIDVFVDATRVTALDENGAEEDIIRFSET